MAGEIAQRLEAADDLWTTVEVRGGRAFYSVKTGKPLYQERLVHMGFATAADGEFRRDLSAHGDVLAIHRNFARHLEDMLLQSARLRRVPWEDTLELFLHRVAGTSLVWFLYGSGALAARGIAVSPGDLDFWVDDAEVAGALFEDLLVEPVTTMNGWVAERGGRAFAGCLFEWIARVDPKIDEPTPHEQGPIAAGRLESVAWRSWTLPVAPLDLQLSVAERRGLTARAAAIRGHLSSGAARR
jgi:hypothetical protein